MSIRAADDIMAPDRLPTPTDRHVATGLRPIEWLIVIIALAGTAILSQGAHDLAINRLGIPYPHDDAVPSWVKYAGQFVRYAAAVVFCRCAAPSLDRKSLVVAACIAGALVAGLAESVRAVVMNWVIGDGWRGLNWLPVLAGQLPRMVTAFYEGAVAFFIARTFRTGWGCAPLLAIAAASAAGYFALLPAVRFALDAIVTSVGAPDPTPLYVPPYGWHVRFYIYFTFLEPVIAALIMARLVWSRVGRAPTQRISRFVLLLLLLNGRIVSFALFSFWIAQPFPLSLLAEGQFLLETLILGLLTGLLWQVLSRRLSASRAR